MTELQNQSYSNIKTKRSRHSFSNFLHGAKEVLYGGSSVCDFDNGANWLLVGAKWTWGEMTGYVWEKKHHVVVIYLSERGSSSLSNDMQVTDCKTRKPLFHDPYESYKSYGSWTCIYAPSLSNDMESTNYTTRKHFVDVAWCCSRLARFVQQFCTQVCALIQFSIPNVRQHVTTWWPNMRNMSHTAMLRYVAII